jgi:chloramphenicol 3-O-phosphotransferase
MNKGKIVWLNGVSSVGKSTLSTLLQKEYYEPFYYIAQDIFADIISPCFSERYSEKESDIIWDNAIKAMIK